MLSPIGRVQRQRAVSDNFCGLDQQAVTENPLEMAFEEK